MKLRAQELQRTLKGDMSILIRVVDILSDLVQHLKEASIR